MSKELTKVEEYAIMKTDPKIIGTLIKENIGEDAEIGVMDLTRVSLPGSGGTTWSIPDFDSPTGELETKEIIGVIIATKKTRQYWPGDFDGGSSPPQCFSDDGTTGIGDPGGLCVDCEYNEFGSKGRRKACNEKQLLFVVRETDFLPIVVGAPAGSLKNVRSYVVWLTQKLMAVHSVYTSLTLETDKNEDGIKYSKIVLKKVGNVEKPDITKAYAEAIRPSLIRSAAEMIKDGTI